MFIRVITFDEADEACGNTPDVNSTSWDDRAYWLYDLHERRWDWPVWGKLFKINPGKHIHEAKEWVIINVGMYNIPEWCVEEVPDEKAVESILSLGNIEYEIKRNGISTYKVNYNDHWYMIVKSIDGLIAVEEVLP